MTLQPGARVGVYEVVSLIGSGGMGEVYLARDTQLGRNVALKVLPDIFASDTERLARFRRESELFFRSPSGAIMSARVTARGDAWGNSPPQQVIPGDGLFVGTQGNPLRTYDVSSDSRRFLVLKNTPVTREVSQGPNIVVIENFSEELKRRVPVK